MKKVCQSCGMPMGPTKDLYGTEKNGSLSEDYCKFCYENGAFKDDCTMEQMMKLCIDLSISYNEFLKTGRCAKISRRLFPFPKKMEKIK